MESLVTPTPSRTAFAFLPGGWQPASQYGARRVTAIWTRTERGVLHFTYGHFYPRVINPANAPAGALDSYKPWITQADQSRQAADWIARTDGREVWFTRPGFTPRRPITPAALDEDPYSTEPSFTGLCGCGCGTPVHAGSQANWIPGKGCRWQWTADNRHAGAIAGSMIRPETQTMLAELMGPTDEDAERICGLFRAAYAAYPLPPIGTDGWWSFPRH